MKTKWIIGAVLLILVLGLYTTHITKEPKPTGKESQPAAPWLTCTTDSDCLPDMNSYTCCSNGKFTDEVRGPCPQEWYKGYCTCNIPEGWSEGICNGLKTETPEVIAIGTPKD